MIWPMKMIGKILNLLHIMVIMELQVMIGIFIMVYIIKVN